MTIGDHQSVIKDHPYSLPTQYHRYGLPYRHEREEEVYLTDKTCSCPIHDISGNTYTVGCVGKLCNLLVSVWVVA